MHALENIRAALRPGGVLVDVRPAPRHPLVELQRRGATDAGTGVLRLGQMDDIYRIETQASADAALQTLIDRGAFAPERAETFTFVYHFDSVEGWLAYMSEHWISARISDELRARARDARPAETDELRIVRAITARRLRRR